MAERYVQSWVWALLTFHWFPKLFSPKTMKVSKNQIILVEPSSILFFWMKKEELIPKKNLSSVSIEYGLFWNTVRLETKGGNFISLNGLNKKTAKSLAKNIQQIIK